MRKIKNFKLFEAGFDNWQGRRPIEDEIDTCLVELGDNGFKWITTDWSINKCVMVNIQKDFSYLDEDARSDMYYKGLHKFNVSDIYESVMLLNDWMFEKYGANVTYKIYRGNSFKDNDDFNVADKEDSVTEILIKYTCDEKDK
jgi:type IV secretory pathway VirB6-like protein